MLNIAISQFRPTKGEYAANLERIGAVLGEAASLDTRPALVVFPETATSGYFVEGGVRDVAVTAGTLLRDLDRVYQVKGRPHDRRVGWVLRAVPEPLLQLLPLRHARRQRRPKCGTCTARCSFRPTACSTKSGSWTAARTGCGRSTPRWGGRAAMLICEDAWHSLAATIAALDGAQVIIVPSASPARGTGADEEGTRLPASMVRWERVVRGHRRGARRVRGATRTWWGSRAGRDSPAARSWSTRWENRRARSPVRGRIVTAELDLEQITHARADAPLLADLQSALPISPRGLGQGRGAREKGTTAR